MSAFHGMRKVLGDFGGRGKDAGVGMSAFLKGSTIYAADLEHSVTGAPVSGSFSAQIDFTTPLPEAYMIVLVGEFSKSITFDADRSVTSF